ncbi:MAG: phage tail sheath subtilisin-like domain-containing protein [Firmicutes bacterium]|jgi:hypothetical protein|nr:phage tail sheath subtilisin-like domain-containing protein [Bacillota bacterium]
MGLPEINIKFVNKAGTLIKRGERGIVALILKDEKSLGYHLLNSTLDIPELSEENKEQIRLAFVGAQGIVKNVKLFVVEKAATSVSTALDYFETEKFDYLAVPEASSDMEAEVVSWIKEMRDSKKIKVKAVLAENVADYEGIINFATSGIKTNDKTFTAKQYCSRIAGVLASMPLTISSTYQVLNEVIDIEHKTSDEIASAIDAGKLVLMNDGEKIKIARGVTSKTTVTSGHGEELKKISLLDKLDMIHSDIKRTIEDNYIGKVSNKYEHKVVLIAAIRGYLTQLESGGILDPNTSDVGVDIGAQEIFIKSLGVDTSEMDEKDIKEYNTKDKVFLYGKMKPLDAMEEITLNIGL